MRPLVFTSLYHHIADIDHLRTCYQLLKGNKAVGVDEVTKAMDANDLEANLQDLSARLKRMGYRPQPKLRVYIPKPGSEKGRPLGISSFEDKIVELATKRVLEPLVEPLFEACSFGYRPGRSPHQCLDALGRTIQQKRVNHLVEADIRGFFDNLDHDLVMRAVRHHTQTRWILLYVERWLKAPVQREDGSLEARTKGSPQGSVISPLLSNLFMHYAFDAWMQRTFPHIQFARYADDAVVHAASLSEAEQLLQAIRERLGQCGLELHPEKTKIVYCKDSDRVDNHDHITFDFLGYTFQPRRARNRWGKYFVSFLPAVSKKAANAIRARIRSWRLGATRNNQSLEEIAWFVNPYVRGWVNYYGRFYRSALAPILRCLERSLTHWARRKYKRLARHKRQGVYWLGRIVRREPKLFVHWQIGIRPATGP